MDLRFANPGFEYSLDSIMLFHSGEQNEHWQHPLFHFYPMINREKLYSLPASLRREYIDEVLRPIYQNEERAISEKVINYNSHWNQHKQLITCAFEDAFQCDFLCRLGGITGNITLNPIEPRFLDTLVFDVFYLNSERGALGVALHEMTHFAWFDVWRKHFGDESCDYETPHIKWIFSEMAVDAIMRRDERLSGINPYFADGSHVYECFRQMRIEGKPVLETLYGMYCHLGITGFMEQGIDFCKKHEDEIRAQMADTI